MKQGQKDLYVLVADQDMRQTMKELLDRGASLGIPSVTYTVARHLQRDPGCRSDASRYLRHRILQLSRSCLQRTQGHLATLVPCDEFMIPSPRLVGFKAVVYEMMRFELQPD